ncbi:hypothetical protein BHE74_00015074 [Ensete ventricosum]|nr:hypothetical protein BHE74_00015074 [Ensete ventricosum]
MVNNKVFRFELYHPIRAVHTSPTGYRYADRPLPCLPTSEEIMPPSPCRNEATPRLSLRDEATPPLPTQERGNASSPRSSCKNEAPPHLPVGGRGGTPSSGRSTGERGTASSTHARE